MAKEIYNAHNLLSINKIGGGKRLGALLRYVRNSEYTLPILMILAGCIFIIHLVGIGGFLSIACVLLVFSALYPFAHGWKKHN